MVKTKFSYLLQTWDVLNGAALVRPELVYTGKIVAKVDQNIRKEIQ